ncbi:helix-turn-helix transcriptional regulator [Streptosporangium amethystogenes subsp. fukuiense]|uniref:Helix-turn-helix transcriptional regulator n=1 Tax=Streptosporangium amethystogenes subsp. fukuiense TaxID=698418 RepID=A0ABW2T9N1_9ACTN
MSIAVEPEPEPDSEPEFDTYSYESTRVQFGRELRKYRILSGFTQRQLCTVVPIAVSHLSMLENGHRAPTRKLAHQLDEAFDLGTTLVDLLDRLDRAATQVPRWFRPWLEFEPLSVSQRIWGALIVPGLLQTEQYAEAILSRSPGVTPEQVKENIVARMDRKNILRRPDPPMLWAILDEGILHRPIADPEVMREQFHYLLEMSESPWLSLQVLPYTARNVLGLLGGFTIADMPGSAPPVAYIDSQSTGDRVSERAEEVKRLEFRYDLIRADALSRNDSRDMIKEAIQRWTT